MKRRKPWLLGVVLGATLLLGFGMYYHITAPPVEFPPGSMLRFDDFDFTALSARESRPGHYEVDIKVSNRAKVVDFDFRGEVVLASNGNGGELKATGEAQTAHLHPGESAIRTIPFQSAPHLREIWVRFEFAGGLFGLIDRVTLGNRQIKLTVDQP